MRVELQCLQSLGIISPVTEPTDWCAPMVVVQKRSGQVRICVDLTRLNLAVKRERHQLPSVEQVLRQMAGAKIFTKLDANSGFHQIPLSDHSYLYTTFITPFGRFAYRHLPFGISFGPELFQREVSRILEGLSCLMDDIVVYGTPHDEHKSNLTQVLRRLADAGITLNADKCLFRASEIQFLGHKISAQGVAADDAKIAAKTNFPPPTNVPGVRRFLGMVNQLCKFIPNLPDLTQPLRVLLRQDRDWMWSPAQAESFCKVKAALCSSPVLLLYDPKLPTKVSTDASSYGLGAVILQLEGQEWRPVAYASRSLSSVETRYAQVEKEALALTWACERFSDYLLGKTFTIDTDH